MNSLQALIIMAEANKPSFGEACNNCGWCCMTEVCSVGKELSNSERIPCKFLKIGGDDKYYCDLAGADKTLDFALAIGTGCDSMTQNEAMQQWRRDDDKVRDGKESH